MIFMQICNICLSNRTDIKKLECKHNICLYCYQQAIQSEKSAYCQICLSPLQQKSRRSSHPNHQSSQQNKNHENSKSDKYYCLECFQPCSLENIRLGKHRNHNFQQLAKSQSFIRLKLDEQYQKSLQIQGILSQFFITLQENCSFEKIDKEREKIKQIFDFAKNSLQARQLALLKQLQDLQNRIEEIQTQKKNFFSKIYEEVQEITEKLENYLDNSSKLIDIQIKQLCRNDNLNHIIDKLKTLKINTITVPEFVYSNLKQQFIQSNFYLIQRYHSKSPKSTNNLDSRDIINKRKVNLWSKIAQKMNKF